MMVTPAKLYKIYIAIFKNIRLINIFCFFYLNNWAKGTVTSTRIIPIIQQLYNNLYNRLFAAFILSVIYFWYITTLLFIDIK